MKTLKKQPKLYVTPEDRNVIMKAFDFNIEDWNTLIFNYGELMVHQNHPMHIYVLETKRFWSWYNAVIADLEELFVNLIRFEKAVEHINNRKPKDKDYCLGLLYIEGVRDLKIPHWQLVQMNDEYKQKHGSIPTYRSRKKQALNNN